MIRIRHSVMGLVAAISVLLTFSPALADSKIGMVDLSQVFQKTALGQSIQAHLKRYTDRRVSKLNKEGKELQDEQGQIRQQMGVISKDALNAKEMAWQKKIQDFQKKKQKIQTEVASESFVAIRKFLNAVNGAAEHLGKKFGFTMIISRNPLPFPPLNFPTHSPRVIYLNPDADLTQSVIKYVDEHQSQ